LTESLRDQPIKNGRSRWRRIFPRRQAVIQGPGFATSAELEDWIANWLSAKINLPAVDIDRDRPFVEYGLDSLVAIEFSAELEKRLGRPISPSIAWEFPTVTDLAAHIMAGGSGEVLDMDAG
jgi:acyl carrier protein